MRCGQLSDGRLREGRRRTQDQIGAIKRFGNRRRDLRQLDFPLAQPVDDRYRTALRAMRLDIFRIPPPQPDFVTSQGKIAGRRERAVAPTQHRNLQDVLRFGSRYATSGCRPPLSPNASSR
jgi:hypothetical protein